MRKTLTILLSTVLILMFAGCSNPEPVEEPSSSEPENEISASEEENHDAVSESVYKNPMAEGYTFWGREEYSAEEMKSYNARGELEYTETSLFDSNGRIISEQIINSEGTASSRKYEYDSDGNCIFQEFEGYFNDEWKSIEWKYEYDVFCMWELNFSLAHSWIEVLPPSQSKIKDFCQLSQRESQGRFAPGMRIATGLRPSQ